VTDTILNNRYRLDAVIGEGGMAVVYRGYDLLLRRQVAVKILRPDHAADPSFVHRFYDEARAAARLSHPNIVTTYDVGDVQGSHYIVEEYVPGETLAALLARQGRLPESVAVRYAVQICLALAAAHRADLLHRDVKPSNILITRDDVVRVTDFGIARAVTTGTLSQADTVMGSVPYCSPEQLSGAALGPASDLYSLGVVLFEMLTGRRPYVAETALGVAMGHLNAAVPDPATYGVPITPALRDVVMKLLQKDPAARFQTAGEALAALRRCSRDEQRPDGGLPGDPTQTAVLRRRAGVFPKDGPRNAVLVEPRWSLHRAAALGAALVAAFVALFAILASREGASRNLVVPDVAGKSQLDALTALHDVGIDDVTLATRPDPDVVAGLADGTQPPAGSPVQPNERVTMYVSTGPPAIVVPDVSGDDLKTAAQTLTALGLRSRTGPGVHSATVRPGLVARTDPVGGSSLAKGETVILLPSLGPLMVSVPNIVSLPLEQAAATLRRLGLKLTTAIVPSPEIPARTVIDQEPAAGATVPPGSTVTADISAGPNAIAVPDLVGMSVDDARNTLLQAGLALGTVGYAAVTDTSPGMIIGQDPAAQTQVPQGTAVNIVVSQVPASPSPQASATPSPAVSATATVIMPNVTGMTLVDAQAALAKLGLRVARIVVVPGSRPDARVGATQPAAGAGVPPGSAVVIYLGTPQP
jgi:beta-lactam-binding protein with PASTA domain/tRNA A-37 threonylcarbamoyl transferase component Bud32